MLITWWIWPGTNPHSEQPFSCCFLLKPDQHPNSVHCTLYLYNWAWLGSTKSCFSWFFLGMLLFCEVFMVSLVAYSTSLPQFTHMRSFLQLSLWLEQHLHPCLCWLCQAAGYAASARSHHLNTFHTERVKQSYKTSIRKLQDIVTSQDFKNPAAHMAL